MLVKATIKYVIWSANPSTLYILIVHLNILILTKCVSLKKKEKKKVSPTTPIRIFKRLCKTQKTQFGSNVHKCTMLSTRHHNMLLFMLVLSFKCQLA